MGKRDYFLSKYGDTRILYKKSNTICTQSRTCSGASQFYTRSGIFQCKKNLSQTNDYYIESGKIKRDLSIETDVCILRRYYKSKRNKTYTRDVTNKSKYSNVLTEVDSVKELRHGACGDSQTMTKEALQVDIAAMMVDNLKDLLSNWIQKHLLENKDAKDKIEGVLHSIMHKGKETKVDKVSSRSTYVLSREGHKCEVKNKKVETAALTCDYCKHKSRLITSNCSSNQIDLSSQSVPSPVKKLRVLSTLSIPRKMFVPKIKSLYKIKKIKRIKKYSVHNPKKLLDSSSFDLLAISTRSFTKRCANYAIRRNKKRRIAFHSEPIYKKTSHTIETEDKEERLAYNEVKKAELEDMPSLVKSIFADHPANTTRPDNITQKNDTFTLTEKKLTHVSLDTDKVIPINDKCTERNSFINNLNEREQSKPIIAYDLLNHSIQGETEVDQSNRYDRGVNVNSRKSVYLNRKRRSLKLAKSRNTHNKKITCHRKDECRSASNELLKHLQTILTIITKDGGQGNFKFDFHVSLLPVNGKTIDASSHISNITIGNNVGPRKIVCNVKSPMAVSIDGKRSTNIINPPKKSPEIIALLDSAASQAKYIFNTDKSIKTELVKPLTEDQGTKTSKLELVQEIHDLKSVVKNLLHTAETLVSEQIKKETEKRMVNPYINNIMDVKPIETLKMPTKPISQGIQISNDFAKNLLFAGIKLSKEPKKDTIELCHRLMRKSTSYKIIESESVLRVTDMTVGGKTDNLNYNAYSLNQAPKSKSMIDVSKENNKVIAYFCEGGCNSDSCCKQNNTVSFYRISSDKIMSTKKKQNSQSSSSCECSKNNTQKAISSDSQSFIPECPTSIYIDIEDCCDKKSSIPHRKGMGFGEGFIYCLLLWIPVVVIAALLYHYVVKDFIHPNDDKIVDKSKHKRLLHLKMSDLGFGE